MKGSREIIEMEENGEIELIETSPNYHMGWVNSDNTSTSITEHEYVPTNWQQVFRKYYFINTYSKIQTKDLKED